MVRIPGNYLSTSTPAILELVQRFAARLRPIDAGAAARWTAAGALATIWFVEPYDWMKEQLGLAPPPPPPDGEDDGAAPNNNGGSG